MSKYENLEKGEIKVVSNCCVFVLEKLEICRQRQGEKKNGQMEIEYTGRKK